MSGKKLLFMLCLLMNACSQKETQKEVITSSFEQPPRWAQEAIWYQIFIERFHNGNKSNDPDLGTMGGALIDNIPQDWQLTPWTHNWYKQEEWAKKTGLDFYRTIQMRRYGGDLQGVKDKIPYLKDLGINAIYFNPLNDAPSLHKYDARHYHHIDPTLGNDKAGDLDKIAKENKANPNDWVWTNADLLFLEIVKEMHANGIKVILDYSWNHTGTQFWAFQDVIKKGKTSAYADWFEIKTLDDPATAKNEFDYEGWFGNKSLPETKKIRETEKVAGHPFEGNLPEPVKQHIFAVCKRWMDPNNDGNFQDGIDGMRLDVAEHVPLGFWRDFRKYVRSINPDFYLVGENWWTQWPDVLMDPVPWVKGDIFDAVMHYHWFKPSRAYINQGDDKIDLKRWYEEMETLFGHYKPETQRAMMNLVSSHDSERVLSAMANTNKYKYFSKPQENKGYHTGKPNAKAYASLKVLLFHQFTFIGSPHIWNGDEMGMWGADDPDNRKPLWWPDYDFEVETPIYPEQKPYEDKPGFDVAMHSFYQSLCKLRKDHPTLSWGEVIYQKQFIGDDVMAYTRKTNNEELHIFINATASPKTIKISPDQMTNKVFELGETTMEGNSLKLGEYSAIILKLAR